MKRKRAKPFNATGRAVKDLEADNWTVGIVEQRIPHTFITRDFLGCFDLIAVSPSRGIMAVQVTGGDGKSNFNSRVEKIKSEARAGIWLASGGRISVMSYEGKGNERKLRQIEIVSEAARLDALSKIVALVTNNNHVDCNCTNCKLMREILALARESVSGDVLSKNCISFEKQK